MKTTKFSKLFAVFGITALAFASCEQYDDSTLSGRVDELDGRVTELEKQIADLNTTVQGISTTIRALQNEERVVAVEQLADGTGYTLTFSDGSTATIKNGEKPSLGIAQDTDNLWYWTVDGEFLLNGTEKIPASNAPEFKIEDGQLFYKVNGGEWQSVPGAETGFGLVQDVKDDADKVTLVLSTGKSIDIPKVQSFSLDVAEIYAGIGAGETVAVNYTVISGDDETLVKAICDNGFTAEVSGDSKTGKIRITAPASVPESASVLLVAVNGKGQMSGKILSFEQGQLSLVENTVTVGSQGGEISIQINTNMNYNKPQIDSGSGWIKEAPETKSMRTDEHTYIVDPYDGSQGESRTGYIYVNYGSGEKETFTVVQVREVVISGGKSDFETFSASGFPMSYIDAATTTTAGWHLNEYCLVLKPTDQQWTAVTHLFPVVCSVNNNGVVEKGILYSPNLKGGCGQLTINYGTSIYDNMNIGFGFKVTVSNGTQNESFEIKKTKEEIVRYEVYKETKDINIAGDFNITIENIGEVSASNAMMKLQGSASIISVEWTGYSE